MRRDLEKDVVGRKIAAAEVRPSKNAMRVIRRHGRRKEFVDRLVGRKILKADRRGKYVLLFLDNGDALVVHFGMSGQFVRGNKRVPLPPHTHVVITFQQGGDLRFVDPRTFGEMFVAAGDDLGKVKELQHIAIDPLDHVFTWQSFGGQMAQRGSKLKQLLMDQKFISGLGNIYSDEVVFAAGLRHDRLSDTLSSQEVRRLYRSLQEVLQEAIRYRGTSHATTAGQAARRGSLDPPFPEHGLDLGGGRLRGPRVPHAERGVAALAGGPSLPRLAHDREIRVELGPPRLLDAVHGPDAAV